MKFFCSPRSEAERIINTLIVIMSGFYEKHGFVVLPELGNEIDPEGVVVLPRLDYGSIAGFWEALKKCSFRVPPKIGDQWVEEVAKLLREKKLDKGLSLQMGELEAEWGRVEKEFLSALGDFFPHTVREISEIQVAVTKYGTVSSGSWIQSGKGQKLYFYLRSDRDIADLASMMVNLILKREKDDLGITWTKREAIMDFVMTRPGIKKLFPRFNPMMNQLTRVPASLRKASSQYLAELWVPKLKQEFDIAGSDLSRLEKRVMKLLTLNRGELVTYDQIADSVWGEGEFKTFWAINKLVGRMRVKLEKLGIEKERVKAVRGQGYLLK